MSQYALAPEKVQNLRDALEKARPSIAAIVPRGLKAEKLIKSALVAAAKNPDLLSCSTKSVVLSVMHAAQLGLDCSGLLGQAYLVPYNSRTGAGRVAQLIPGYRGLIALARRSGEIEDLYAEAVYEGDEFRLVRGDAPSVHHVPAVTGARDDAKIIGAYMVAWMKGSTRPHIEWMTRAEIEAARAMSQGRNSLMWTSFYGEACRKTVIRRGIKYLPLSIEEPLLQAVAAEDAAEAGVDPALMIDGEVVDLDEPAPPPAAAPLVEKIRRRSRQAEEAKPPAEEPPAQPEENEDFSNPSKFALTVGKLLVGLEKRVGPERRQMLVDQWLYDAGVQSLSQVPAERRGEIVAWLRGQAEGA